MDTYIYIIPSLAAVCVVAYIIMVSFRGFGCLRLNTSKFIEVVGLLDLALKTKDWALPCVFKAGGMSVSGGLHTHAFFNSPSTSERPTNNGSIT